MNSSGTSQALLSVLSPTKARVNFLLGSLRPKWSNIIKFGPHCLSVTPVWHYKLPQTSPQKAVNGKEWSRWKPWRHMKVQLHAFLTSVLMVHFTPRLFYSRTKRPRYPLNSRLGGSQTVWTLPGIEPPFFGHPALSLILIPATVSPLCVKCANIKWITHAQRRSRFVSTSCVYSTRFIFLFAVCAHVLGSALDVFDSYYNLL